MNYSIYYANNANCRLQRSYSQLPAT